MGTIRTLTRQDGTEVHHAEVRLRGSPPQRASFRTLTLAKKWIQKVESAIRDGRHFRSVESKKHTVGEMIDRFIAQWLPKYPERQAKQTALLSWWKAKWGHLLLSDLTSAVIAESRDLLLAEITITGRSRSSSTVNRYLSALGKVLTVAVKEWGWLEDSPMRKVTKLAEGKGRNRFLSIDEQRRLLEECRKSRNPNLYPMTVLAIKTGMRLGELTSLRWRDICFEMKKITLLKTKNGDIRYLPLTEEVEATLRTCPTFGLPLDELIFQSGRNHATQKTVSIREAFESALRRANIQGFRWHDLRHTAASYMAMSGATQGELMSILGHRSPVMTRRYAHYSQDHLKKVMERTEKAFEPKGDK